MKLLKSLIGISLLAGAVAAQASVFDLTSSYPTGAGAPNPNGPFSYRSASSGFFGPNSSLFDSTIYNGSTTGCYNAAEGPGRVALFRDTAGNDIEGVPAGQVGVRTGTSLMSGFRFTSPEAGPVTLTGSIGGGSAGAVDILVAVNGFTVSTTPNVTTGTFTFTSPVDIAVGNYIEVFLADSAHTSRITKAVGATITIGQPVPEPASIAALGLGGLALVRNRRKGAR